MSNSLSLKFSIWDRVAIWFLNFVDLSNSGCLLLIWENTLSGHHCLGCGPQTHGLSVLTPTLSLVSKRILMLILTLLVKRIGIVRPLFQLMSTFSRLEHRQVNFVACYTSIQFYSDWLSFVRGIHHNSGKSGLCTSLFSFEVHLKFPSWRNLVFMCVTQMIVPPLVRFVYLLFYL